jgi:hypothetical protein
MNPRRSWVLATVALATVNACALVPVASPSPGVATATPGSSQVATATPIITTLATASPTNASTPSVTTSPTAIPSPTAAPSPILLDAHWDLERITDRGTSTVSMAIDGAGIAHVVATTKQGIAYWTNESGTWARQPIGLPSDDRASDRNPAIAVSESGAIVVAYERSSCSPVGCGGAHVFVTFRTSSGWSSPALVAGGFAPSLATRDGVIGVVYRAEDLSDIACEAPAPIDYAVLSGGSWVIERVTENGWGALLTYGPGATPQIVLTNLCGYLGEAGLYLAVSGDSGSSFALEPIPGTSPHDNRAYAVAVDDSGRTHLLYVRYDDDDNAQSFYNVRDPGGWATPLEPLPGRLVRWMAVDGAGHMHVVGQDAEGAWHATNRSGDITFDHVSSDFAGYVDAAVALDAAGRPHVLLRTDPEGGSPAIWYGVQTTPDSSEVLANRAIEIPGAAVEACASVSDRSGAHHGPISQLAVRYVRRASVVLVV